jgi:hypothetical protein
VINKSLLDDGGRYAFPISRLSRWSNQYDLRVVDRSTGERAIDFQESVPFAYAGENFDLGASRFEPAVEEYERLIRMKPEISDQAPLFVDLKGPANPYYIDVDELLLEAPTVFADMDEWGFPYTIHQAARLRTTASTIAGPGSATIDLRPDGADDWDGPDYAAINRDFRFSAFDLAVDIGDVMTLGNAVVIDSRPSAVYEIPATSTEFPATTSTQHVETALYEADTLPQDASPPWVEVAPMSPDEAIRGVMPCDAGDACVTPGKLVIQDLPVTQTGVDLPAYYYTQVRDLSPATTNAAPATPARCGVRIIVNSAATVQLPCSRTPWGTRRPASHPSARPPASACSG